jgi:hypothetical protein
MPIKEKSTTSYCRNCGKELGGTPNLCMNCGARPTTGKNFCNTCGAATNPLAEICIKCGTRLVNSPTRSAKLTAVGIINIVGGCISLIGSVFCALLITIGGTLGELTGGNPSHAFDMIPTVLFAGGIVAIIGGIYALKRKSWGFVLASSIVMFSLTFPVFLTFVGGIVSIVLTARSKKDFV